MKRGILRGAACLCAWAWASVPAWALPEASIGYQGRLRLESDPTGLERLGQPIELRFWLYRAETGGEPVWGRAVSVTPDAEGNFATVLSDASGTPLLEEAPALGAVLGGGGIDAPLWLTFAAGRGESPELAPRQPIRPLAAAYAASSAETGADGFTVSGTLKAYTFEAGEATFAQPVRCRNLTVTDPEGTLSVPEGLRLSGGLSLMGGELASETRVTLGPMTSGGGFLPVGSIVMWWGAATEIPEGWALCDKTNGTPDLRGRFLRGEGSGCAVGTTGGTDSVTLTEAQLPKHTHTVTHDIASNRNVDLFWLSRGGENEDERTWRGDATRQGVAAAAKAAAEPHENRPPYCALYFIRRIR